MMILVDLGNTRVKWAQVPVNTLEVGTPVQTVAELVALWSECSKPHRVLACSVRSQSENQALVEWVEAHWQVSIEWLQAEAEALGVRNSYQLPATLGADRWAALLGAHHRYGAQAMVLVSAGTALVVDALSADGIFLGGMILPGYRLMKSSLAEQTAKLPFAQGQFEDFPQCTEDAIETGCLSALLGAVHAMQSRLQQIGQPVQTVLMGGDAQRLLPHLNGSIWCSEDLVLQGLLAFATLDQTKGNEHP